MYIPVSRSSTWSSSGCSLTPMSVTFDKILNKIILTPICILFQELDPCIVCWKGASVMCCLDTAQELWIKQPEWDKLGVRTLREKAPFIWV